MFLFVVGVVMPLAFYKRLARGDSKRRLYCHIILRSVILFVLGMVAQGNLLKLDLRELKIFCNTLQAIAVGYLISSIIMLNLRVVWQVVATAGTDIPIARMRAATESICVPPASTSLPEKLLAIPAATAIMGSPPIRTVSSGDETVQSCILAATISQTCSFMETGLRI